MTLSNYQQERALAARRAARHRRNRWRRAPLWLRRRVRAGRGPQRP